MPPQGAVHFLARKSGEKISPWAFKLLYSMTGLLVLGAFYSIPALLTTSEASLRAETLLFRTFRTDGQPWDTLPQRSVSTRQSASAYSDPSLAPRTNKHVRNRDLEVCPKSSLPKVGEPENVYGFGLARPGPHSRFMFISGWRAPH